MPEKNDEKSSNRIEVNCPNGHRFRLSDRYAGKRVRCPKCSEVLKVGEQLTQDVVEPNATVAPRKVTSTKIELKEVEQKEAERLRERKTLPKLRELPETDFDLAAAARLIKQPWGANFGSGQEKTAPSNPPSKPSIFGLILGALSLCLLPLGLLVAWLVVTIRQPVSDDPHEIATTVQQPGSQLSKADQDASIVPDSQDKFSSSERPRTVVDLPEAMNRVVVGGEGRYLVTFLPQSKQVAVFDVAQKIVRKWITIADHDVLLAAGKTKFVVFRRSTKSISRHDLETGECEELKDCSRFQDLTMGCASEGPLFGVESGIEIIDLSTLKSTESKEISSAMVVSPNSVQVGGFHLRASADSRFFAGWGVTHPPIIFTFQQSNDSWEIHRASSSSGYVVPSPDGSIVYTDNNRLRSNGSRLRNSTERRGFNFPGATGHVYASLEWSMKGPQSGFESLTLRNQADESSIIKLTDITFPKTMEQIQSEHLEADQFRRLPMDQRIFWLPVVDSLVTVPLAANQFIVHRLNVHEELEKSGKNYLLVTSIAPPNFSKGKLFDYQIEIASKKGNAKFELLSGPPGMSVSSRGLVSWNVPRDFLGSEVDASIAIRDDSNQTISHNVKLTLPSSVGWAAQRPIPQPRSTVAKFPTNNQKQSSAIGNDSRATTTREKTIIPLPSPIKQLVLAGSGSHVLAVLPEAKQVAIVENASKRIVNTIPLDDPEAIAAAGASKFVILQQTVGTIARYDLVTAECERKVASESYRNLTMGLASEGPLLAIGKQIALIDLETLNVQELESEKVRFDVQLVNHSKAIFQADANGKTFHGYGQQNPPGHFTLQLKDGSWQGAYDHLGHQSVGRFFSDLNKFNLTIEAPRRNANRNQQITRLTVLTSWNQSPVFSVSDIEASELPEETTQINRVIPYFQRLMWFSAAKAILAIPSSGDRLIFHHFDLQKELEKSGNIIPYVEPHRADRFRIGERYSYQMDVFSGPPIAQYAIISGPVGMTVSPDGLVTWQVPTTQAAKEIVASIGVRNEAGRTATQNVTLSLTSEPKDTEPSRDRRLQKTNSSVDSKPPTRSMPSSNVPSVATAQTTREPVTVPLPAPVQRTSIGGSGRYLIATVPIAKSIVVLDVAAKKLRKTIEIDDPAPLIAAGESKFVIFQPSQQSISRYDLSTLECELTKTCENFNSIAMGSSSEGPVIVGGKNIDFLDLTSLESCGLRMQNPISRFPTEEVTASANGQTFIATARGGGIRTWLLEIEGMQIHERSCEPTISPKPVQPSPDGRILFTGLGRFDGDWKRLSKGDSPYNVRTLIPAATGPYYLSLSLPGIDRTPVDSRPQLMIHCQNDETPIMSIAGINLPKVDRTIHPAHLVQLDLVHRLFLLPIVNALVTVPDSKDQFLIHDFSLDDELRRSGLDYFFVSSTPPQAIETGTAFSYQIETKSKHEPLQFKMNVGPPGMAVSDQGLVTWQVPKNFNANVALATIKIRNDIGQELVHTLRLRNAKPKNPN